MPSAKITKINKLQNDITNLKNLITKIKPINSYTTTIKETKKPNSYGLTDLLANKTPTYSGWTVNPTDGSNMTDGNITTFCNTGNKVAAGGWQWGYIYFDLGAFYNVLITGFGGTTTDAGSGYFYIALYDGANYQNMHYHSADKNPRPMITASGVTSRIRLALTTNGAATFSPNIRELHAWRLQ